MLFLFSVISTYSFTYPFPLFSQSYLFPSFVLIFSPFSVSFSLICLLTQSLSFLSFYFPFFSSTYFSYRFNYLFRLFTRFLYFHGLFHLLEIHSHLSNHSSSAINFSYIFPLFSSFLSYSFIYLFHLFTRFSLLLTFIFIFFTPSSFIPTYYATHPLTNLSNVFFLPFFNFHYSYSHWSSRLSRRFLFPFLCLVYLNSFSSWSFPLLFLIFLLKFHSLVLLIHLTSLFTTSCLHYQLCFVIIWLIYSVFYTPSLYYFCLFSKFSFSYSSTYLSSYSLYFPFLTPFSPSFASL